MNKFLTDREFAGVVSSPEATTADEDTKNRGRYKVLIPELMYNCYDDDGQIYCMNHVSKYRNTQCNSGEGIYGQYLPLHPGTKVIVKFYEEDLQTGYIDRIISDYYENSLPLELETTDRDQYYQLLRTIANDLIAVTNETTSEKVPKNGFHIYHKKDNVIIIFDETGIHIYSKKDFDQQIDGNAYIKVDGKVDCVFASDLNMKVSGSVKIGVEGQCDLNVSGNCSVDATFIYLNCKKSQKPSISEKEKTKTITFDTKKEIADDFI